VRNVQWLPALGEEGPDDSAPSEETLTLPVFPLGVCYLPFTQHVLNIFEPRYRAMYSDILFNGSRRFVVTMIDPQSGRLAKTGVVFHLDDLKGAPLYRMHRPFDPRQRPPSATSQPRTPAPPRPPSLRRAFLPPPPLAGCRVQRCRSRRGTWSNTCASTR
jgi:hypothetical protein